MVNVAAVNMRNGAAGDSHFMFFRLSGVGA
jgi:hypothetical protein